MAHFKYMVVCWLQVQLYQSQRLVLVFSALSCEGHHTTQVVRMWAFFGVLFVNPFVMTYGRWCQSILTQSVSHLLDNLLTILC